MPNVLTCVFCPLKPLLGGSRKETSPLRTKSSLAILKMRVLLLKRGMIREGARGCAPSASGALDENKQHMRVMDTHLVNAVGVAAGLLREIPV